MIAGAAAAFALLASSPRALGQACTTDVPHVTGSWRTLPYQVPINPISATLLYTGEVLLVAGSENDGYNHQNGAEAYRAAVWDPTGTDGTSFTVKRLGYDVFCSGTAMLPHGRVLIIGGTMDYVFNGETRATIFDPATGVFAQSQSMADGRWYGTATTLPDGRILAFSGLGTTNTTSTRVEMYDPASPGAGWGAPLNHTFVPPLYPRAFVLPNGKVFYSGHGSGSSNSRGYILDPVARTWTNSANTSGNRQYGTVVMLPLLPPSYTPKIMAFGGGPNPAKKTTDIIDMSAATPAWAPGPAMSSERVQLGAVLLPNGRVFVEGGSLNNETPDAGGKTAQLYTPAPTNAFASAGTAAFSRLYHSAALLLPDATVVSLGSNPGDRGKYLGAIEIYTPPYLFDANDKLITAGRPAITGAPSGPIGYGQPLSVTYTSDTAISSAVLVRPGSTTHAFDMEQRIVGLCGPSPQPACSGSGGTLELTTPPNGNVAPPGYYMLFLLDAAGVPSHARFVELSPFPGTPPDGAITTPGSDVTINAGGSVSFGTTTVSPAYSWIFPGGAPATSSVKNPGSVTFSNPGEYYVSMTAIASGDTDPSPPTRKITVRPVTAAFELAVAPDARTIIPGGSATFTVTVTPRAGFAGTVTLGAASEGGFPAGVTSGGFSPPTITGSGTSTLTMNTTAGAAPYAVTVSITGVSGGVTRGTSATLLLNLSPPGGLAASPTPGEIQLSWLPSTGASSYQVFRGEGAGGGYESIGCTNLTTLTDTSAEPGKTYYYVAQASYTGSPVQGGVSARSDEIASALVCPPPTYSGALSAARPGGIPTWDWSSGGAGAFDLLQGDLGTLRATGGDFGAALDSVGSACLANDTTALSLPDPAEPAPGEGVFALVRPVTTICPAHGSADDGSPTLFAPRDGGILAAATTCP